MTRIEFEIQITNLEMEKELYKNKADKGDWYAELDYRRVVREQGELRRITMKACLSKWSRNL